MNVNLEIPDIAKRWRNPNGTPGEVFVTAHRGAFLRDNQIVKAENSIPAIRRARDLGCDNVEVDVHFTSDGTAVVMHDATLDRTSAGSGNIADKRYDEIKDIPLVHPATRQPFDCTIPTLEDVFLELGDAMMINVELKTQIEDLPRIAKTAAQAGVSHQVTLKSNQKDAAGLENVAEIIDATPHFADFIPVLIDSRDTLEMLETACDLFELHCVECIVDYPFGPEGYNLVDRLGYTPDGGLWFSIEARRMLNQRNIRQFLNTLYTSPNIPGCQWNGGRDCQLARIAPDSVYSFWIAHGASVIQTDEPEFLLDWLRVAGFRTDGCTA